MIRSFSIAGVLLIALFGIGCAKSDEHAAATRTAADNSEITTSVDAAGTKTETRTFKNNPRVAKVVVTTTKDGRRTVKAYSPSGEEKEVTGGDSENVLEATGDKVADGAHFVADKAEDVGGVVKKDAVKVADATVDTAKDVSKKTVETSKTVGEKTVDTTKTVGEKTASGTKAVVKGAETGVKKTGSAVKKVIPN